MSEKMINRKVKWGSKNGRGLDIQGPRTARFREPPGTQDAGVYKAKGNHGESYINMPIAGSALVVGLFAVDRQSLSSCDALVPT